MPRYSEEFKAKARPASASTITSGDSATSCNPGGGTTAMSSGTICGTITAVLAGFTLEKICTGRHHTIAKVRQQALDQSFEAHPARSARGRPKLAMPPASIPINPVQPDDDSRVPYSVVNFSTLSAAVDTARKSTIILKDLSESGAQVQAIARFLVSIQRFLVQTLYRKWRRNWAISLNYVGQQWRAGDK